MTWTARFLLCFIAAAAGGVDIAAAETGSFDAPAVRGVRLDYCKHWGNQCGKPAADLFCREMGFAEAQRFVLEKNAGASAGRTLVFGDGRLCEGADCDGFRAITCSRPDQQAAPATPPPVIAVAPIQPIVPMPPVVAIRPAPPPMLAVKPVPPPVAMQPAVPPPVLTLKPPVIMPFPPMKPEVAVVVPHLPPPPTAGPQMGAPAGAPLFAMPDGASLVRCTSSSCEFAVTHDFDIDPRDADQSEHFIGRVDKLPLANGFRWQVATSPFPAFQSGAATDLDPPGLLASGDLAGKEMGFNLDFKEIVGNLEGRAAPLPNLYVRLLPLAQPGSNALVGQPSNAMRIYYASVPPPQEPIKIYESTPPILFTTKVVSFTPPDFENPNRWGCVKIVGYKGAVPAMVKSAYPVGGEVCPKSFKGGGYQITSVGEFVDWAVGGAGSAVDWVSDRYEDLKQIAVDVVMKYTPFGQQCALIGKMIDDGAPAYCELAAEIAVNAGLAALGVPPSIPNYNELVDKGVDYAVEMAAAQIYEQTGIPCVGPCEDALHDGFGKAAEELKNTSYTPGCVGENEAHQHGREPLCLPEFIIAKPASGAVYSPPVATVEVDRLFADKNPSSIYKGGCTLTAGIRFENHFSGGTVWGPSFAESMNVPGQDVFGYLYKGIGMPMSEAMPKGAKKTMTFVFTAPEKFLFPWTKQLWSKSQIPPHDFMGGDWYALYWGAVAKVGASLNCAAQGDTLTYQLPEL